MNVLRLENEDLKAALFKTNSDLTNYKDNLKKLYAQYCEQERKIETLLLQQSDQLRDFDRFGERNLDMQV